MKYVPRAIVLCVGLCCLYVLGAGQVQAAEEIRFRTSAHLVILPVNINKSGPYDFMLDTGATSTIVQPSLAEKLGLRPTDRIILETVAGERTVPRCHPESIAIGDTVVAHPEVLVTDVTELQRIDRRIQGVIGQNILAQFDFLIEYRSKRIVFDTRDDLHHRLWGGTRLPVDVDEGRRLVMLPGDAAPIRMVADSGAAGMLFFHRAPQRDVEWEEDGLAITNSGSQPVRMGIYRTLKVGRETLRDVPMAVLGRTERREDGLLPTHIFDAVYFNNRDGYVVLNPKLDAKPRFAAPPVP